MNDGPPTGDKNSGTKTPDGGQAAWEADERAARPATVGDRGSRIWLYPDRRPGPRASLRRNLAVILIAFYVVAPFVSLGDRPFLRFDVITGRASIFGMTFLNSDAPLLVFVLLALALTLFLVTSLRGRLWCGYACPQTVFIDWLIRPIEEMIEGKAHQRRLADKGPRTPAWWTRKVLKHLIFVGIAAAVANIFLAYFVPPAILLKWMTSPPWEHPAGFAVMAGVMGAFYFDLAWFREQFCAFLCPYARFQSVMFDTDTPTVAYDHRRGEPRGKLSAKRAGACVDCGLCVRVCPTGIDIRKGNQLECIACERCVDACDTIMDSVSRPRGLIRIASQRQIEAAPPRRGVRPRVVLYSALVAASLAGLVISIVRQREVNLALVRAPGTAFVTTPDGRIMNNFVISAANYQDRSIPLKFTIAEPSGADLVCGGCAGELAPWAEQHINLVVMFPQPAAGAPAHLRLIHDASGTELQATLLSP